MHDIGFLADTWYTDILQHIKPVTDTGTDFLFLHI